MEYKDFQHIEFEHRDNGILLMTLNRPDKLNATNKRLHWELTQVWRVIDEDPKTKVAVVTGKGRAFSAGGDLDFIQARAEAGRADAGGRARGRNREAMRTFYGLFLAVRELHCPSIAAIHGAAVGAGLCVALACDLRVAARDARLSLNFVRLGIHPGMGATWTLPRLVGAAHAADLLLSGRTIDGEEAARMGLVNRCVERDAVLVEARALAGELAAGAPAAVRGTRAALARAPHVSLEDQLAFEAARQAECYESDDLREGLAAARAKRTPVFRGA